MNRSSSGDDTRISPSVDGFDSRPVHTKQQDNISSLLDFRTPLSLHDQLLSERVGGYKDLGRGPLEPEPVKRMSYEQYLELKRMEFP